MSGRTNKTAGFPFVAELSAGTSGGRRPGVGDHVRGVEWT